MSAVAKSETLPASEPADTLRNGISGSARVSKHTPGPWKVINEDKTTPCVVADGIQIGHALIAEVHDLCIPKQHDEDVANARLIAAAPDLLAACIEAQGMLVEAQCDAANVGGSECAEATAFKDSIDQLCAAIAKAKGNF